MNFFRNVLIVWLILFGVKSYSHEMTPAYVEFEPTTEQNILQIKLNMFNKRKDVEYYQFYVYDEQWNKIAFAMPERIVRLRYLERKKFTVYIRRKDRNNVVYVCSVSKLKKGEFKHTIVESRVCSKMRN